ncbi:MAG TPA: GNAT family N-acetyltransferase [Thermoplasmata archaeon]|nr:GNAT family N-acetyltransferase [Thermoplasmata archaeon]
MLREFTPGDLPELLDLLGRHFPEEDALLGRKPESYRRIVERIYRPHYRFAIGLLRVLGRPLYRFFVIEADRRIAATTIVTFPARAGYVSTVMVDTPYRRRGYARRLLREAASVTRRSHRRYLVLDVLTHNTAARALYDSLGFEWLRRQAYMVREFPPPAEPLAATPGVRSFRRGDARSLVGVAAAALPPLVSEVLPPSEAQFQARDPISDALESETAAWVVDGSGSAEAYVGATVSRSVLSANLTAPVVGPGVDESRAGALVATALCWIQDRHVPRVLSEVADHNVRGRRALEAQGFREAFGMDTLLLRL